MSDKEMLLCRVILRKIAAGSSVEVALATYPQLVGESLERVVEYVNRNS